MDFDPSPHADPPRFGPAPSDPDPPDPHTPDSSASLRPRAKLAPVAPPLAGFIAPPTVPVAELADDEPPPPPPPPLPPRGRRVALPICLFVATCVTTFWAGTGGWFDPLAVFFPMYAGARIAAFWQEGLIYMAAVMSILFAHEMGHFLQAVRYRVPASLPYFIPMPLTPMGTMGAVIGMRGLQANRRELFDIGLTGPWAGLVLALPISWIGIAMAEPAPMTGPPPPGGIIYIFHDPLLFQLMIKWLHGNLLPGQELQLNPLLQAGWVGMLVTGLNMLPIGQLDGGHVAYAILGRRAHWLARGMALAAAAYIVIAQDYTWVVMLMLVMLLGIRHPPTSDDTVPLGWPRIVIGLLSLIIPIMCLTPTPLTIIEGPLP